MKKLTDIPSHICPPDEQNHVIYSDTDSIYVHAEPLLNYIKNDFESLSDKDKDKILEKIAIYFQNSITNYYDEMALRIFNSKDHRLEMKTEAIIRSSYFRATRRYAQWITKEEGIEKDYLNIKGLEFMKANFPVKLGDFFYKVLQDIVKGAPITHITPQIQDFKRNMLNGNLSLEEIATPASVKTLNKYKGKKPRAGEIFTQIEKGAKADVKGCIIYNDLLKFWGYDKDYNMITQADKIKWVYLKDNPYKIQTISFLPENIPQKIEKFIEMYVDKEKSFDSLLTRKFIGLFEDLGWEFNLNPYQSIFDKLKINI